MTWWEFWGIAAVGVIVTYVFWEYFETVNLVVRHVGKRDYYIPGVIILVTIGTLAAAIIRDEPTIIIVILALILGLASLVILFTISMKFFLREWRKSRWKFDRFSDRVDVLYETHWRELSFLSRLDQRPPDFPPELEYQGVVVYR